MQAEADLLEVVDALGAPGRLRAACTAGKSSPIRTAMIAMTTSNSINVKPRLLMRCMIGTLRSWRTNGIDDEGRLVDRGASDGPGNT